MLSLDTASAIAPPVPAITYESRVVPRDRHTTIEIRGERAIHVVTTRHELDPRGARWLTEKTARHMRKIDWQYENTSGLLVPSSVLGPTVPRAWPAVEFTVEDDMDPREPVVIFDGIVVILVVVWSELLTAEGALYMTEAVRDHMSGGRWQREDPSTLWLPGWLRV